MWLVPRSGVSQQRRSLAWGGFGAGKQRPCPVVTVATGHGVTGACGVFLSLCRNVAHVAFLSAGLELLLGSEAGAGEGCSPQTLTCCHGQRKGPRCFPTDGPMEGSAASLQLL